ncbi:hypothetical protein B0H13DRAFT_255498 [Mycena leptocephala]|nr:hypothetical protein B0H13DRAFT_255498 [Mycena leptocephala]
MSHGALVGSAPFGARSRWGCWCGDRAGCAAARRRVPFMSGGERNMLADSHLFHVIFSRGPTLCCTYAHYSPHVLATAGVHLPPSHTFLDAIAKTTKASASDKKSRCAEDGAGRVGVIGLEGGDLRARRRRQFWTCCGGRDFAIGVDLEFGRRSSSHLHTAPSASQEPERSQEREHDRAAVPCSASTLPATGCSPPAQLGIYSQGL